MKQLFERNMFWIILLSFPVGWVILQLFSSTYTLNRTIGWGWDITNFFWQSIVFFVLLLGYGTVYFLKRKTNFYLSLLHILMLGALFLSTFTYFDLTLLRVLQIGSFLLFLVNIFSSKKVMALS